MRAGIIVGKGALELREFPEPVPALDGVVVEVSRCGICGTDVHAYAHGGPYIDTLCGHEWTGHISAVGRNVRTHAEGDRVVVGILPPCGACPYCAAGMPGSCLMALASLTHDPNGSPHGAYATHIAASAARVIPAHPALTDEAAALVEPATVAYHGVRRAGIQPGDLVVVQGAGPIGAFALQWCRTFGAGHVVVIEPDPARGALAIGLGADEVLAPGDSATTRVLELSGGRGADVVVECAGVPSTIQSAIELARRAGRVMVIGLSDLPATVIPGIWLMKEAEVRASIAYSHDEFADVMGHLADGSVAAEPLHTSTVGLSGLDDALARLAAGAPDETKILVDPHR